MKSEKPRWFTARTDRLAPLADVKVDMEFAADLTTNWGRAGLVAWRQDLLRRFNVVIASRQQMNWSELSPWELVQLVDGSEAVRRGLTACLPTEFADLSSVDAAWIYLHALAQVPPPSDAVDEVSYWPLVALDFFISGPPAAREIERRGRDHVPGIAAARVRLAMQGFTKSGPGIFGMYPEDAVRELQARATRYLPPQLRDRPSEHTENLRGDVLGQIALTVARRKGLGDVDGFEALARALLGEHDILPRAIGNDVVKESRTVRDRRSREDPVVEHRGGSLRKNEIDQLEQLVLRTQHDEREAAAEGAINERTDWLVAHLRRDPQGRRLLAAFAALKAEEKPTQVELAKKLGIGDRQLRNLIAEARRFLVENPPES